MSAYLILGTARSNNGLENYNKTFKKIANNNKAMRIYDFLNALEDYVSVTSLTINENYINKFAYYHKDMEKNRKSEIRRMHDRALNEDFFSHSITITS